MRYRRVAQTDYPGLLSLQEANLYDNLPPAERDDGFLSARFDRDQFARMDADVGVLVAADTATIAGYVCASGIEFNRQFPILAAMIERFGETTFQGRPLAGRRTLIYGPVCIARAYRGRGVLRGLYAALRREAAGRFDSGTAFVAQDNVRSLGAHIDGLGMSDAGQFTFNAKRYRILAFALA
jgi:Acetyltransferase (GNAT) family